MEIEISRTYCRCFALRERHGPLLRRKSEREREREQERKRLCSINVMTCRFGVEVAKLTFGCWLTARSGSERTLEREKLDFIRG